MSLSKTQRETIEQILINSLRHKFNNYNPEPASMPFHARLLGQDRLALYSFIHSLSTNFGTAIFEPVAVAIAKNNHKEASSQVTAGDFIYEGAHLAISQIMNHLTTASNDPDKSHEIETIRAVCQQGDRIKVRLTKVDVMIEDSSGDKHLFDLKTAKPNSGAFREFKRTLLEWVAAVLAENPKARVHSLIAIPYNPYEPQPYNRRTMRGMLDLTQELKVGKEFWDFLGGSGTYEGLLDCFEKVGLELRGEIDDYFTKFRHDHQHLQ